MTLVVGPVSLYPRVRALARILYREEAHIGHSAQNDVWAARVVLRAGNAERGCVIISLYLSVIMSWSPAISLNRGIE